MLGVARTRKEVSIERVAINMMDAALKDNCGYRPEEEPIVPDGPTAYFSTLPVKQIAAAVQQEGLPCKVSNTAGTYVCNAVYDSALDESARCGMSRQVLFVHLPTESVMPISSMSAAIVRIIQQCL